MATEQQKVTKKGLHAGDMAPMFELKGTYNEGERTHEYPTYHLKDYRGRPVLLVFFSAAFTPT